MRKINAKATVCMYYKCATDFYYTLYDIDDNKIKQGVLPYWRFMDYRTNHPEIKFISIE